MENKFFLHQVKHSNGVFDKGIVIKDTFEAAKQSYHAYLGAYAYGYDKNVDFVQCFITEALSSTVLMSETWIKPVETPSNIE